MSLRIKKSKILMQLVVLIERLQSSVLSVLKVLAMAR